jgi:hypothetical protein
MTYGIGNPVTVLGQTQICVWLNQLMESQPFLLNDGIWDNTDINKQQQQQNLPRQYRYKQTTTTNPAQINNHCAIRKQSI